MAQRPQRASLDGSTQELLHLYGTVAVCSDVGRTRSNNEDNFLVFDLTRRTSLPAGKEIRFSFAHPGVLVAVADGMGGHSSGQVASRLCVETLPQELLKLFPEKPADPIDWNRALPQAVTATNDSLYSTARSNREYEGMGTTLTAILFNGRQGWVAQVGDSRAYLFRGGRLSQLTHDQTVFNTLREEERAALRDTPFENMLLQAVGAMTRLDVGMVTVDLEPDDVLLLCSDGLYKVVNNEKMTEVLSKPGSLQAKVEVLVGAANAGGGPDNVTVILCGVGKGEGE